MTSPSGANALQQPSIPFATAVEPDPREQAETELLTVHPSALLPPLEDIRDRTTPEYRDWFERLVRDVQANGIRQPLVAYREGDYLRVIDGETRRLAALVACLTSVSVLALADKIEGTALKVAMLQANALRCDMSELDYAKVYLELMEQNAWSQARLARELNHPAPVIAKRLSVVRHLPEDLLAKLGEEEGQIPFSVAYLLSCAFRDCGDDTLEKQRLEEEVERKGGEAARQQDAQPLTPRRLARRVLRGLANRADVEEDLKEMLGKAKSPKDKRPLTLNLTGGSKVVLADGTFKVFKTLAAKLSDIVAAFEERGYSAEHFRSLLPTLLK